MQHLFYRVVSWTGHGDDNGLTSSQEFGPNNLLSTKRTTATCNKWLVSKSEDHSSKWDLTEKIGNNRYLRMFCRYTNSRFIEWGCFSHYNFQSS